MRSEKYLVLFRKCIGFESIIVKHLAFFRLRIIALWKARFYFKSTIFQGFHDSCLLERVILFSEIWYSLSLRG